MIDENKTIHHLELRQTTGKDVTVTAKNLEKEIKVSPDGNWGILTDTCRFVIKSLYFRL